MNENFTETLSAIGKMLSKKNVAQLRQAISVIEDLIKQAEGNTSAAALEAAKWTTAYVNSLPDSSFAVIEPGGKKDSEGKTTPRSLRHLPYKDNNGKVDLPHLRNALARLDQTKISSDLKTKARTKLENAAKEAGIGDYGKKKAAASAYIHLDAQDGSLIIEELTAGERLGTIFERKRIELGMTMAAVAEKLPIRESAYRSIESGYNTIPPDDILQSICDVLGLDFAEVKTTALMDKDQPVMSFW